MKHLLRRSNYQLIYVFFAMLLCVVSARMSYALSGSSIDIVQFTLMESAFPKAYDLSQQFLINTAIVSNKIDLGYYAALSALYVGKYAEAQAVLQDLLKQNGSVLQKQKIYLALMDVYFLQEQYEEAVKISDVFMGEFPQTDFKSTWYFKRAKIDFRLAQWSQAQELLDKILIEFPLAPETFVAQGLKQEKPFFSVQVGSFQDKAKAQALMQLLSAQVDNVYLFESQDIRGQIFYRVRVGYFTQLAQAKESAQRLGALGYPTKIYP